MRMFFVYSEAKETHQPISLSNTVMVVIIFIINSTTRATKMTPTYKKHFPETENVLTG